MIISVVSPVYKGEKMLEELVTRIKASVATITSDFEIILVNDCSPDESWDIIKKIAKDDCKVKGVNLSRNFGQHCAISAGLSKTCGEWVVVLDCDLQDRPEEIPSLYKKASEGYDVVFAQRAERCDTFIKKMESRLFHMVFDFLTGVKSDASVSNFGIYHRKVINAVLQMGDAIRTFGCLVQWVGFRKTAIPVVHSERAEGSSGYSFFKALGLALNTMLGFSDRLLRLVLQCGFSIFSLSLCVAFYYLISYFTGSIQVSGFTTLVISLWLLFGFTIMLLGVIGLYIGKIFDRVKGRPIFIIDDELNFQER